MGRTRTDDAATLAAKNHVEWMEEYGLAWVEPPDTQGFSGATVWDRLATAGFADASSYDHGAWDMIGYGSPCSDAQESARA